MIHLSILNTNLESKFTLWLHLLDPEKADDRKVKQLNKHVSMLCTGRHEVVYA